MYELFFLQKYLFCKKRQNILICELFHKGGGEDFDDVLDELGGLGKSNKTDVQKRKELEIELREITAKHNVDDRKIPKATPLLAPWSSLPHHAFPVASPGSAINIHILSALFHLPAMFVSQFCHMFANSQKESK